MKKNSIVKIIIVSYYFYPENTPRAFRVFELAKEFSIRGCKVELVIPQINFDYRYIENEFGFEITRIPPGIWFNRNGKNAMGSSGVTNFKSTKFNVARLKSLFKRIMETLFPSGILFEYAIVLSKYFKHRADKYDMLLSVASPFSVHLGMALAVRRGYLSTKIKIAEYGDPFYSNPLTPKIFHLKLIERWVLKYFDYIVIPTKLAVDSYTKYKNKSCIKVIPQGFNLDKIRIAEYHKNHIPTFAYAGSFNKKIRDPSFFLEFLIGLSIDFCFVIFTKVDFQFKDIFEYYTKILNGRLVIKDCHGREDCIYQLSKFDFLINFENKSTNQVPSKIIDYKLSKRPILSINPLFFSPKVFMDFVNGNYIHALEVDIEKYNIKHICNKYLDLIK